MPLDKTLIGKVNAAVVYLAWACLVLFLLSFLLAITIAILETKLFDNLIGAMFLGSGVGMLLFSIIHIVLSLLLPSPHRIKGLDEI